MKYIFFEEIQTTWQLISGDGIFDIEEFNSRINKEQLNVFQYGNFYYYLFDVSNLRFSYIHPDIRKVLGYTVEEVDLNFFLSKIHPDDQVVFLNNENTVSHFFSKLPIDKYKKYKIAYDYRVKNSEGIYIRILQQVMVVNHNQNAIITTMGIHTDISHLKSSNKSTLSFIGLQNEPSFYNVEVKEVYTPSKLQMTKREKEIIHLILKGMSSKQISELLAISSHTVATHRKNILKKTNTKTSLELQNRVINDGLL